MSFLPTRRWLRFSIRTLLIAVTILCMWLGWAMQWIHQRRDAVDRAGAVTRNGEADAPWPLRILGEPGSATVVVNVHGETLKEANERAQQISPQIERLQKLFPEAEIKTLR